MHIKGALKSIVYGIKEGTDTEEDENAQQNEWVYETGITQDLDLASSVGKSRKTKGEIQGTAFPQRHIVIP